jgi:hypothetical protein
VARSELVWSRTVLAPVRTASLSLNTPFITPFGFYVSGDYQFAQRWFLGARFAVVLIEYVIHHGNPEFELVVRHDQVFRWRFKVRNRLDSRRGRVEVADQFFNDCLG